MSPPEMLELGPIPALPPPPVAASGASTSAATTHEQRPDSGIDLSNGGSTAGSYETNGIFTKEHALQGTLTVGRDARVLTFDVKLLTPPLRTNPMLWFHMSLREIKVMTMSMKASTPLENFQLRFRP